METDWRFDNAQHLKGQSFRFKRYVKWSDEWDHDHCKGCWVKFAEFEAKDVLNEGYATTEDYPRGENYGWVCADCFEALKDILSFREIK